MNENNSKDHHSIINSQQNPMESKIETIKEFENDNYMTKCFTAKHNIYPDDVPGAGLEDNKNLMLCLRNVPKKIDNQALKNILSNYGDIVNVSHMKDSSYLRFAQCKNLTSLEAVLRGMSLNEWNIQVSQKTEKKENSSTSELSIESSKIKSVVNNPITAKPTDTFLHPSLEILRIYEYTNQCSETSYFQNKRIAEYNYSIRNKTYDGVSRNEIIDIKDNELCKISKIVSQNIDLYNCFACGKFATKICDKCKEFYCSKECQNADWPNHKFICCEKPDLVLSKGTKKCGDPYKNLRSTNKTKEKIDSGANILITHVEKSNLVFIRSNENPDRNDYIKILNIIASNASKSKPLMKLPTAGTLVLSEHNNEWYRAIVLHPVSENKILIAYPDFGFTKLASMYELKELALNLVDFKQFTICIYLKNIEDVVLNEEAENFLYYLIKENVPLKVIYNENEKINNIFVAELISLETNRNINKYLNKLVVPIKQSIYLAPILLEDINLIKFKESRNVKLIILDNSFIESGFIHCILNNDANEIEKINAQIKNYAVQHSDYYTPRENEICLAKTSDNPEFWYRAVCEFVSGNGKPGLSLLDYGNLCEIPIANIRKCPKELNLPCYTNLCYIQGFQRAVKNKTITNTIKSKLIFLLKLYTLLTVPEIKSVDNEIHIKLPQEIVSYIKYDKIIEYDENDFSKFYTNF